MEINLNMLFSKNSDLADALELSSSMVEAGQDIELFRHDYESVRKFFKAKPMEELYVNGHKLVSGRSKRPRRKKPQEIALF